MMMRDGVGDCSSRASARPKPRPEELPVMRMLVLESLEVYFDWSWLDMTSERSLEVVNTI